MSAIIGFLIFLFFCAFIVVGIIAFNIYRSFRAVKQKFADFKTAHGAMADTVTQHNPPTTR